MHFRMYASPRTSTVCVTAGNSHPAQVAGLWQATDKILDSSAWLWSSSNNRLSVTEYSLRIFLVMLGIKQNPLHARKHYHF